MRMRMQEKISLISNVLLDITVIIVITTAANTAMYPDDVTGLQDNVTEDVNRAGTTKLVSRNALLGHLEITVAENVDIVWTDVITSMEAAYMDVYKDTEENSANINV